MEIRPSEHNSNKLDLTGNPSNWQQWTEVWQIPFPGRAKNVALATSSSANSFPLQMTLHGDLVIEQVWLIPPGGFNELNRPALRLRTSRRAAAALAAAVALARGRCCYCCCEPRAGQSRSSCCCSSSFSPRHKLATQTPKYYRKVTPHCASNKNNLQ